MPIRVLLINPPRYDAKLCTLRDEICFQDVKYVPFPLRLGQAAGVLRALDGVEVRAIDANATGLGWNDLAGRDLAADVVIFQSAPGLIAHDVRTAVLAKRANPECAVVLVESVVTPIYTERFLGDFPSIDVLVLGTPEVVVPDVVINLGDLGQAKGIAYRADGEVRETEPAGPLEDMDALPLMAYDLFPMELYSIGYLNAPMHEKIVPGVRLRTTRDCPYHCPFCIIGSTVRRGYHGRWQAMSPGRVLEELGHVVGRWGLRGFYFWDETFTLDRDRTAAICEGILKARLKLEWRCLTRVDCVDPALLSLMSRAGCRLIEYGIETGDPAVRAKLKKGFSDEDAANAVRWARAAGIRVNCDLIVGMPDESEETLGKTLHLARKLGADNMHLTMAFPYPMTELHRIVTDDDLLEVDDLYRLMVHERVRVGAKPVFRTRNLSREALEAGWSNIRRSVDRHYFVRNIILRPWDLAGDFEGCRSIGDVLGVFTKGVRVSVNKFLGK
jgi:radical SAM superfamily enzyme YgiQ (UPF0313 family)